MEPSASPAGIGPAGLVLPSWVRLATPSLLVLALAVAAFLPQGENPGAGRATFDPATGRHEFVHDFSLVETLSIVTGILAGYLLLLSPLFAFPRVLRVLPRRVQLGIHRWLGAAILLLALAHGALLPFLGFFRGWLSGLLGLALLAAHGASGIWKRPLVGRWGVDGWRYLHQATAWGALALALFHSLLSGVIAHNGG